MTESRLISTFPRILHAVKRRAEGSALLIGVGLVAIAAALAAPRATEPLALALPLPLPNRTNLALITRADRVRADEARRHALSFAVRSVGEMLRRVGEASARRGGNAEAALIDLRALTARALGTEDERGLLALRAVQAELFVSASRAFAESGTVSPELRELGGDFPELATTSGWRTGGKLLLSAEELALLFRMRWNDLTGLSSRPPFAATLDEYRDRYALLLRHPSGDSDAVRLQRQLGYVGALEKLDHDYPAAFARGVLFYRSAAYEASAAAFRMHLELRPNGPWALRARNHLLAALAQTEK